MINFPDDRELIHFAEGIDDSDKQNQVVLNQLASSPEIRQQIAAIRRDLYLVDSQIPQYHLKPELVAEVNKLAELWLNIQHSKRFHLRRFLYSSEFLGLIGFLSFLLLTALVIIWLQ